MMSLLDGLLLSESTVIPGLIARYLFFALLYVGISGLVFRAARQYIDDYDGGALAYAWLWPISIPLTPIILLASFVFSLGAGD